MVNWQKEGTVHKECLHVGQWTELIATINGVDYYLGCIKDGNIIIETKIVDHKSTNRRMDIRIPAQTSVEFRGIMEEIHRDNMLILLGRPPTESKEGNPGDI